MSTYFDKTYDEHRDPCPAFDRDAFDTAMSHGAIWADASGERALLNTSVRMFRVSVAVFRKMISDGWIVKDGGLDEGVYIWVLARS